MAKFYVSVNRGSDAAGDGSAANPWKTIDKAVGSGAAAALDSANPNTLYIEPGVYRESVALGVSPTASGRLTIQGDCDGGGFAAGGYSSPATGLVDWRAWSSDAAALTSECLVVNSKSYLSIRRVKMIAGNQSNGALSFTGGASFTVEDCIFVSHYGTNNGRGITAAATAGAALDLTINRCGFITLVGSNGAVYVRNQPHTADYDLNVLVRNCWFDGRNGGLYVFQPGGSGTYAGGGITFQNNTVRSGYYGVYGIVGASTVPSKPIAVYGCLFLGCGLRATVPGQIVENGNIFTSDSTNQNVAAGANSITSACPALDFGDGRLTGLPYQPYGTPSRVSSFVGFGSHGTTPTDDLAGRGRPEGAGTTAPSVGCLERHDTGVQDFSRQDEGSPACMALVGPSSQERPILVDPVSTTLSVKVRWDGNHGDANKPQAVLIAEPQIGVPGQTVTATSTGGVGAVPNAYETLTFAPFTPTSPGVVMLRMVSRAAAGNGSAYFDTITF